MPKIIVLSRDSLPDQTASAVKSDIATLLAANAHTQTEALQVFLSAELILVPMPLDSKASMTSLQHLSVMKLDERYQQVVGEVLERCAASIESKTEGGHLTGERLWGCVGWSSWAGWWGELPWGFCSWASKLIEIFQICLSQGKALEGCGGITQSIMEGGGTLEGRRKGSASKAGNLLVRRSDERGSKREGVFFCLGRGGGLLCPSQTSSSCLWPCDQMAVGKAEGRYHQAGRGSAERCGDSIEVQLQMNIQQ